MKVFLTGGSGYVGREVVSLLVAQGYSITVLVNQQPVPEHPLIRPVFIDWRDTEALADEIRGNEVVIHCAALISFRKRDKHRLFHINSGMTSAMLQASSWAGVRRFIHLSSVAAVGASPVSGQYQSDFPFNLKSLRVNYAISKNAADQDVLRACHEGLETIILCPGNITGPNDYRYSNLGYFKSALLNLPVVPDGGVAGVDVRDVAFAVLSAIHKGQSGKKYLLSAGSLTYAQVVDTICGKQKRRWVMPKLLYYLLGYSSELLETLFRVDLPFSIEKSRLGGYYFWFDGSEAESVFGFRYRPLADSYRDSIEWYRKQGVLS